jgi:hypothetical protein
MLRRISGILISAGLLCIFAATAGAVAVPTAFEATYWWMPNGTTVINNGEEVGNAIAKVHQVDYYRENRTYFTYDLTNLAYLPAEGHNGLSGFQIHIDPFVYDYMGAPPVDPLTGNSWLAVGGPLNTNMPEWDALWGFEEFDPTLKNTYGLYPVGAVAAAAPLNHALFAYSVAGEVAIGEVGAEIYSWGDDPAFGPAPVAYHHGLVSGPTGPVVPEPTTLMLLGLGVAGVVLVRRKA